MLNDVIFNDEKSAYDEWNIVLTKTEIPLPTPKTSSVDIKVLMVYLIYQRYLLEIYFMIIEQ